MKVFKSLSTFILLSIFLLITAFSSGKKPKLDKEEKAIMLVVEQFFEHMTTQDTAALRNIIMDGTIYNAYIDTEDGGLIHQLSAESWMTSLVNPEVQVVEKYWDTEIKYHNGIATVWTAYELHKNKKFSHCGHNAFSLVKTSEGWKITNSIFSIEKKCK